LAYVGVADSYLLLSEYGGIPTAEAVPKSRTASQQAIDLDPGLGEAHASLAYTLAFHDWKWSEAEIEFRRAIDLSPNYATAHQWYSEYLIVNGRFEEGIAEINKASQLDPLSLIISSAIAGHYYMSRRYDKAIEQAKKVLEMDPKFIYAHAFLWLSYEQAGMIEQAAEAMFVGDSVYLPQEAVAAERAAYEKGGWRGVWQMKYDQMTTPPFDAVYSDYHRALAALRIGDFEKTFQWLERSGEKRHRWFPNLNYDPEWDPIRSDPRFADLVRKASLDPH
jgi:tetratricopeptide (TPR) repeat protein